MGVEDRGGCGEDQSVEMIGRGVPGGEVTAHGGVWHVEEGEADRLHRCSCCGAVATAGVVANGVEQPVVQAVQLGSQLVRPAFREVFAAVEHEYDRFVEVIPRPSWDVQHRITRGVVEVELGKGRDEAFLVSANGANPQARQDEVAGLEPVVDRAARRSQLLGDAADRRARGPSRAMTSAVASRIESEENFAGRPMAGGWYRRARTDSSHRAARGTRHDIDVTRSRDCTLIRVSSTHQQCGGAASEAVTSLHVVEAPRTVSLRLLIGQRQLRRRPGVTAAHVVLGAPLGSTPASTSHSVRTVAVIGWRARHHLDQAWEELATNSPWSQGWSVILRPVRATGPWCDAPTDDGAAASGRSPLVVLTLGDLRARHARSFLRHAGRVGQQLTRVDGVLWATALARPPFVGTCSLWDSPEAIERFAYAGVGGSAHLEAMAANDATPFHVDPSFVRFETLATSGTVPGLGARLGHDVAPPRGGDRRGAHS